MILHEEHRNCKQERLLLALFPGAAVGYASVWLALHYLVYKHWRRSVALGVHQHNNVRLSSV